MVGSTLPNSTYGQSVSFTVTVSGGGPQPTGTVQFVVDGTDLGSRGDAVGREATSPSTTLLGAGSHTVQAEYSGDSNYAANTGSYTQVVNQAPLSIVPDNLSRAVGQANPTLTYTFTWIRQRGHATSANITGTANLSTTAAAEQPGGRLPDHGDGRGHAVGGELRLPGGRFRHGHADRDAGTASRWWWARRWRTRRTGSR